MTDTLPPLIGLMWNIEKSPQFSTQIQRSVDMTEYRSQVAQFPIYNFKLGYDLLRDGPGYTELQTLVGFFLNQKGAFKEFYYVDPDDYQVTGQQFGVGNGSSSFQLLRNYGGFEEWVAWPISISSVYRSGHVYSPSEYMINQGMVYFNEAPPDESILRWTGTYAFRCRFKNDTLSFKAFMNMLWDAKTVEFVGSLWSKI